MKTMVEEQVAMAPNLKSRGKDEAKAQLGPHQAASICQLHLLTWLPTVWGGGCPAKKTGGRQTCCWGHSSNLIWQQVCPPFVSHQSLHCRTATSFLEPLNGSAAKHCDKQQNWVMYCPLYDAGILECNEGKLSSSFSLVMSVYQLILCQPRCRIPN